MAEAKITSNGQCWLVLYQGQEFLHLQHEEPEPIVTQWFIFIYPNRLELCDEPLSEKLDKAFRQEEYLLNHPWERKGGN